MRYFATQPIADLCEETVQMPGTWFAKSWWEQKGLDLVGLWAAAAAAEEKGWAEETEVESE